MVVWLVWDPLFFAAGRLHNLCPPFLAAGRKGLLLPSRDQCKTLPLDDQGGIKGGLDRVWRVGNRESLLRCASRASLAAHKGEVLEVLQGSRRAGGGMVVWGRD